ncbi:unnamed protein product [Penicillium salamii]|uniref:Uncharacterized protein n=1 Tax=Penicillium salamii TaxID=1612424 RepID=A0A9W4NDD0_9EURO|nr:unnamed protein product [Penicillium salamii]CAG8253948.1 unnamed protein product [Penicillium salamii]CAG8271376.1 unnamed protein product [Penicillium salamii]CAG8362941.1 unnamed protein product [Penicillium salamii]CAG8407756.1 unnamed protein product [Penicillium salamii]
MASPSSRSTIHSPKDGVRNDSIKTEQELVRSGDIYALQQFRWDQYEKDRRKMRWQDASFDLLDTEYELREIFHEELSIKESNESDSTASERLRCLNDQYQILSLQWWFHRTNIDGVQWRAFKLWRSHPQWYMHSELVKDCVGRQGCCARGCGCCLNRNIDSSRHLSVGHCTLECGCCARNRGFEMSEAEKTDLKNLYKSQWKDGRNIRSLWIRRVSIWGLSDMRGRNPFDMIDAPPSYEQSERRANARAG